MVLLSTDTTYQGSSSVTASQIDTAFKKYGATLPNFGNLVVKYATLFGFRAEALAGQISEETGWLTNWWTTAHNNVLSIGVTGEAVSTAKTTADWQVQDTPQGKKWLKGYHFDSTEAGILAGCIHMAYYIYGSVQTAWPSTARFWFGDVKSDPRLPALLSTTYPGTVKKLGDLGGGRFAASPNYGAAIVSRGNTVMGTPTIIESKLGVPATTAAFYAWLTAKGIKVVTSIVDDGWVGRGGLQPEAIVHHITDGDSVQGSIDWWKRADVEGSTHQIVAGLNDPNFAEGTLVITRKDEDQAWANGAWGDKPRTDLETVGRWFKQNINPNRVTLSREHSGRPANAKLFSAKMMNTSFFADLNWMAKYPLIKADRTHLLRHADIDPTNRANCPGPYFPLDGLINQLLTEMTAAPVESARFERFLTAWKEIEAGNIGLEEAWTRLRSK